MTALAHRLSAFRDATVLVIGDCIVDEFIWGKVSRISPEAPVPVVEVTRESLNLGGAANVAANIHSLGGRVLLCGVVGEDEMAGALRRRMAAMGLDTGGIVPAPDRPTMVKTRVIAHHQQVVRFDRERCAGLPPAVLDQVLAFLDQRLAQCDAVVVSDYAKGMICPAVMDLLHRRLGTPPAKPVVVDPKPKPGRLDLFAGTTVLTPNQVEAEALVGRPLAGEAEIEAGCRDLLARLGCRAVLVTRGEAGMALVEEGSDLFTIPTRAREVFDVTGAGDTVVAVLALGLAAGLDLRRAATVANHAAGIVVGKVGTATVTMEELLEVLA